MKGKGKERERSGPAGNPRGLREGYSFLFSLWRWFRAKVRKLVERVWGKTHGKKVGNRKVQKYVIYVL